MSDGVAYDVDPEDFRINSDPLNGAVFKRDNVKFHKFLKSLTQGTEAWKWIDNSKVLRGDMKYIRKNYDGSDKDKRFMNITKAGMKEL